MLNGLRLTAVACIAVAIAGCSNSKYGKPGQPLKRLGDEIVVCGQLFHTGAPVVLWTDPGGYDAYRVECKFTADRKLPSKPAGKPQPNRYHSMRDHVPDEMQEKVREHNWTLDDLQQYVDLFVIHYDVCGTSRQCFKVLHDIRGLSVHFLLDVDGTIYQTLDLKERAWQTGQANDRSIGIEIANIGAYRNMDVLNKWYAEDEKGRTYLTLPKWMKTTGIRTPDFVAYPARNEPVHGNIQDKDLIQYDLTDEQYESLIKLVATVGQTLPRVKPDYPRDDNGKLRTTELSQEEFDNYSGLLGHYPVTRKKIDPGPAFDWDRVVNGAKKLMR